MSPRPQRSVSVLAPTEMAPPDEEDPRVVDRFVVIGRLSADAEGVWYAAIDPDQPGDALRALRILRSRPESDPLHRRLAALAAAPHAQDCPPLGFDAAAERPWILTPFLTGVPLAQHLRDRGALGAGRLIALAAGLAGALSRLHAGGIAHGALKVSRVLLTAEGPRLLLADIHHAEGGAALTQADDVRAWAAVIAAAASGDADAARPSARPAADEEAGAAEDEDDEDLTAGVAEVAPDLLPLIRRALDPDPDARPSARELQGSALAAWESLRDTTLGDTAPAEPVGEGGDSAADAEPAEAPSAAAPAAERRGPLEHVAEQEWGGLAVPAGLPRVFYLPDPHAAPPRRQRVALIAGTAAAALALIGGGTWVGVAMVGGGDGEAAAAESGAGPGADPTAAEAAPIVVRFSSAADQPSPAEGPWQYTLVERAEPADGSGEASPDFADQWVSASGDEPLEARIADDATVLCARYCHNPGVVTVDEEGRGTFDGLTGVDFIGYLQYGELEVVADVEFSDEESDDGLPVITRITELYEP